MDRAPTSVRTQADAPWHRGLTKYHWWVLVVASLGWMFDTMDQQLFNLARRPAITQLLARHGATPTAGMVAEYAGYATMIFMIGWASGGVFFGIPGIILGPFLGAALGEYAARGELRRAGKVGIGTWIGMLVAAVAKVVLAVAMVATYAVAYFWR